MARPTLSRRRGCCEYVDLCRFLLNSSQRVDGALHCISDQALRILKLARYSTSLQSIGKVLRGCIRAVRALLVFAAVGCVLFGSLLFAVEAGMVATCHMMRVMLSSIGWVVDWFARE